MCIHVQQILQTVEIKNSYIPNKLYEIIEQIIQEKQIFIEGENK
jgi:hypothetical protein